MTDARAATLAVDLSCSGLAVAAASASAVLSPVVAPASVLAGLDGSALPPGGDRIECSDRADEAAARFPARCLADPVAHAHRDRVDVAGLSVPVSELLAAPVARALRWAGASAGDNDGDGDAAVLVVPSDWGTSRTTRLVAAARDVGVAARVVRSALVTAEALPSSSARWAVCVEASRTRTTVSLVERARGGLTLVDRAVVQRRDPFRDTAADDEVPRILDAVTGLRRRRREAATGSAEVLVRGRVAERVVDACDRARLLSFVVPEVAPVEAAARLYATS
ncbi:MULTISPECIES: hypothetical protein [Dietzia]|uniref:Molecular chaperone n=1 Tax=Dietzia cinnamea TaxID=321318 RepID=A0AAW5QA43_9ACTN|nr:MULTISPECIES: hypothetical protein [Dietzia]KZO58167.1 hypothetical protein A2U19_12595 [Dietzia maris]MBM7229198.1 hypothetical protein [Dietzia cinnamea]MCT1641303.1 hypothetical protein [Dietzia cinnamea]MCT1862865.1 hypothetical protein [Dietzia cinnamea]MCT1884811.1 hypothetical protein [Dietzia cinnamea]